MTHFIVTNCYFLHNRIFIFVGQYKVWLGDAPYAGELLVKGSPIFERAIHHPFYVPETPPTLSPVINTKPDFVSLPVLLPRPRPTKPTNVPPPPSPATSTAQPIVVVNKPTLSLPTKPIQIPTIPIASKPPVSVTTKPTIPTLMPSKATVSLPITAKPLPLPTPTNISPTYVPPSASPTNDQNQPTVTVYKPTVYFRPTVSEPTVYLRPTIYFKPPDSSPSPSVNNSPFITIAIKFDDKPEEIGWSVSSSRNELISSKPIGSYSYSSYKNKLVLERVYVPEGYTYSSSKNNKNDISSTSRSSDGMIFVTILDSGKNGLCCDSGQGFFQIFLGDISENNVVVKGSKFKRVQYFDISLHQ